jgi:two-component system NtrC family sensor kinase
VKPRILIVDDSLTVRMDLAAAFKMADFDTVLCATIGSARAALAQDRFDLIVLDLLFPDGDGLAFLQELKSNVSREIPTMLLTTEAEVRHRVQGMGAGADEYIG